MPRNFYLRGLQAVAVWCVRHPKLTLALGALCVVVAGLYSSVNISMDSDPRKLVRQDAPFRRAYEDYLAAFPQFKDMTIVVLDGESIAAVDGAQSELASVLRGRRDVAASVYAPGNGAWYEDHAFLYLDIDELERLAVRLAEAQPVLAALSVDPSLRGLFDELRSGVERIAEDGEMPAGFDLMTERVARVARSLTAGEPRAFSWAEELFDPPGRVYRLLIVQAQLVFGEPAPAGRLIDSIREEAARLQLTPKNGVRVRLTGMVPLNHAELISARDGVFLSAAFASVMLLVILGLGLRSLRVILATLAALVLSLTATTAWAMASVGEFNTVSAAFAVLLIGLGVDFGIHIGLRYEEELAAGASAADALDGAVAHTAAPISLCTLTSAIGFAAFIPTEFRGLAALGIIASGGMLAALVASYTVLPAVLTLTKPTVSRLEGQGGRWVELARLVETHSVPIVAVTAALAVGAFVLAWTGMTFDFTTLGLKDPESESMLALRELEAQGVVTDYSVTAVAESFDEADVLAGELRALDLVSKADPPSAQVPEGQDEKLELLEDVSFYLETVLHPGPAAHSPSRAENLASTRALIDAVVALPDEVDPEALVMARNLSDALVPIESVDDAAALEDLLLSDLPDRLEWLRRALKVAEVSFADLPADMQSRFVAEDGRALVIALPEEDVSDVNTLRRFVDSVETVASTVTGRPVVEKALGEIVVGSFREAIGIAFVSILVILFLTLRRLDDSLIVLTPIALAALFTVAFGVLTGIRFNIANVVAVPLILGLGVDSGIHVFMRYREDGDLSHAIASTTPRAVMLSALTTLAAFGSLSLSGHRGISSLGVLLSVSIVALLYCTLVVLPALVEVRSRLAERRSRP